MSIHGSELVPSTQPPAPSPVPFTLIQGCGTAGIFQRNGRDLNYENQIWGFNDGWSKKGSEPSEKVTTVAGRLYRVSKARVHAHA